LLAAVTAFGVVMAVPSRTAAQTPPADLTGRTIRLLVGQAAGGVTDLEARLIATHMARYLPGNPRIVVQNVTGAGGLRMLEYFTQLDPAGDLAVAVVPGTVPFRAAAGRLEIAFDPTGLAWIGSFADSTIVCLFSTASGFVTTEDLTRRDARIGLLSTGGANNAIRLLLNRAIGSRLVPIVGYESLATLVLAVRRNEIDGLCSPYSSYPSLIAPLVDDGTATIVLYLGPTRRDEIAAPYLFDLPIDPQERAFLRVALASISLARPLAMAGNTDPAIVATIRAAFDAAVADPAFVAAAAAAGISIDPVDAAGVTAAVAALYGLPEETRMAIDALLFAE
jgi:tripartite-type tricarboxylate transporter receptor subunit TctC